MLCWRDAEGSRTVDGADFRGINIATSAVARHWPKFALAQKGGEAWYIAFWREASR